MGTLSTAVPCLTNMNYPMMNWLCPRGRDLGVVSEMGHSLAANRNQSRMCCDSMMLVTRSSSGVQS